MKKIKKYSVFFLCVITLFILIINIFIIFSHNSLSSKVENLNETKAKITSLDNFKTIIVNLGHSQKFYLLSLDDNYKVKYDNYLSDAYDSLNDLSKSKFINDDYKDTLINMLKEYDNINNKLLVPKIELPLNDEMKLNLSKSNELQINLMHSVANAIATNRDDTSQNQLSIADSITNQKKFIQGLSSIITVIMGGPFLHILKKYKNGEIKIDDIITTLDKEKIRIDNYNNILTFVSVLNNHNKEMKKQWYEVKDKVEILQASITELKTKAVNTNISPFSDFSSEVQAMEIQLLEIKLLVKQLPDYHQFIISLTDSLISNDKN